MRKLRDLGSHGYTKNLLRGVMTFFMFNLENDRYKHNLVHKTVQYRLFQVLFSSYPCSDCSRLCVLVVEKIYLVLFVNVIYLQRSQRC